MKTNYYLAMCLMMLLCPSKADAQQSIQKAFDTLIKSKKAEVSSRLCVSKEPETGEKTSQADIFEFCISKDDSLLVENVMKAFESDRENAYEINFKNNPPKLKKEKAAGTFSNNLSSPYFTQPQNFLTPHDVIVILAGSDEYRREITIGIIPGSSYAYALFLDKKDKTGKHRYAYAIEWVEENQNIKGRLIVTYALMNKYRKTSEFPQLFQPNKNASPSWLSQFGSLKDVFRKVAKSPSATMVAYNIYAKCKDAKDVPATDIGIAVEELERMKKLTDDEYIISLFDHSIKALKK